MTREGHTWAEKERGQVITKKKTYVEQLLKNVVEQVKKREKLGKKRNIWAKKGIFRC